MESGTVMAATAEITFSITRRSEILTLFSIDMLVLQRDSRNDQIYPTVKDPITSREIDTISLDLLSQTARITKHHVPTA